MAKQIRTVITTFTQDVDDFAALCQQAARLKRHGRVEMSLSNLSEKTTWDVPEGGSSWHDYTSYLPSLEKFVPHEDIAPFVDMKHVAKNMKLLRECAKVIRKHKMGAAFHFHLPRFLPEAYFKKYPHRRGPRIDHPRRSRREEFSPCADMQENLDIWSSMWGELCRELPEMGTAIISTNDAGGGVCWGDWIYSGPNGPMHCRHIGVGPRVKGMIEALRRGAAGVEVDYDYSGNFSEKEWQALELHHDAKFTTRTQSGPHPRQVHIGSSKLNVPVSLGLFNPFVKGLINPVEQLVQMERLKEPAVETLCIDVTNIYNRGHEPADVTEKLLEMVDGFLEERPFGRAKRMAFLRKMCVKWVGEDQADTLVDAFHDLYEVIEFKIAALSGGFWINECAVVARHINRPLVAKPELLTKEEEDYWLPHVFNKNREAARLDYIDIQGGRMSAGSSVSHDHYGRKTTIDLICERMKSVWDRLEGLKGRNAEVFRKMGTSLRIVACALRTAGNFYGVQQVRDRNAAKFAGDKTVPNKTADWVGDPDLQRLIGCMRDELDNTTELIRILENGGLELVVTAKKASEEDCFLLGPDLVPQLKKKCEIMRRHWLDAEDYLASPFK